MAMNGELFVDLARQVEDWLDPQPSPCPTLSPVGHGGEAERAKVLGRVQGLSEEQVEDVIVAWAAAYRASCWPMSWAEVRRALIARSMGDGWRPPRLGPPAL